MSHSGRFRILSLDGGGVKGAYTAAVLATLEASSGKHLAEHFDLIAGTSTGGIIAIGLGLGMSAGEILDFYRKRGAEIFPSTGVTTRFRQQLRRAVAPKHSADPLNRALVDVFGARLLGESRQRLVIPSFDAIASDIHVFKTAHDRRFREDYQRSAVEVARATSAAPTFLPLFMSSWGQRFLDGGLWANSPSVSAILEATGVLGVPFGDIELLSIGTTSEPFSPARFAERGGLFHYRSGLIKLILQSQERAVGAQTRLLNPTVLRIDHVVNEGLYKLDDARWIEELAARGQYDGRHHGPAVIARFLDVPATPFTPVYQLAVA